MPLNVDKIKKNDRRSLFSDEIKNKISNSLDFNNPDANYDNIARYKNYIKEVLLNSTDLLLALHNQDLESEIEGFSQNVAQLRGSDYYNVNVFSFLKIPEIQSSKKNFLCFDIADTDVPKYNDSYMIRQIIFRPVAHESDVKTEFGIDRQDLIALIVKHLFNWNNFLGLHWQLVYDNPKVFENGYYYRDIRYETRITNDLIGKAQMVQRLKNPSYINGNQRRI